MTQEKKRRKLCEALRANKGTGWALFITNGIKDKYHQCKQPAVKLVNNEYSEAGGKKEIWLCADCDEMSATR